MSANDHNDSGRWPRFLSGFATGLLLLSLVSCGTLGAILGLNRQSLTALQSNAAVWTPPATTPTATPAAPASADAGALPFAGESIVRNVTNSRVNLRRTPGYLGKPADDVLAQARPGDTMQVLGDNASADGLTWWRIRYTREGERAVDAWIAEATASGVQILGPVQAE